MIACRSEPERFARERRAYQEAQHHYATLLHNAKRSGKALLPCAAQLQQL